MQIASINIRGNGVGEGGCLQLLDALGSDQGYLRHLDLSDNQLGGGVRLASAIAECLHMSSLLEMNLSKNNIGDLVVSKIAHAITSNHENQLTSLNLSASNINAKGAHAIAAMLCHNHTLQNLNLSWNRIRKNSATVLAESLSNNTALQCLDLGWNAVNRDALWGFVESLRTNKTLTDLILSNNNINVDDACLLAEILGLNKGFKGSPNRGHKGLNKGLQNLDLDDNPIGRIGGRVLLHTIVQLQCQVRVKIRNCSLDRVDLPSVTEANAVDFDLQGPAGTHT